MDKVFEYAVGSAPLDQQIDFPAMSVTVDNPTNQWVRIDGLAASIPQYTLGACYAMPASQRARVSFTAPAGQAEPPIIAGQVATITFHDLTLPLSAGVGMLGGRAPYYDRNPLDILQSGNLQANANSGTFVSWTYTVPAGRRAYIETIFVATQITANYANDNNLIESDIRILPPGGGNLSIAEAFIFHGTLAGTIHSLVVGASIELQPGDAISGVFFDGRAAGAGSAFHIANMKATEFDA